MKKITTATPEKWAEVERIRERWIAEQTMRRPDDDIRAVVAGEGASGCGRGAQEVTPLYSVCTWDTEAEAYTPQEGLSVPSQNVDIHGLRRVLKKLRTMGYSCHYVRDSDGSHECNDWCVLVERTDGAIMDGTR